MRCPFQEVVLSKSTIEFKSLPPLVRSPLTCPSHSPSGSSTSYRSTRPQTSLQSTHANLSCERICHTTSQPRNRPQTSTGGNRTVWTIRNNITISFVGGSYDMERNRFSGVPNKYLSVRRRPPPRPLLRPGLPPDHIPPWSFIHLNTL